MLGSAEAQAAPGDLDPSFGGRGIVSTPEMERVEAVAAAPAGEAVAAGEQDTNIVIIRFTPAGTPDPAFGADGTQVLDLGGVERVYEVAVDSSNRVLVAGSSDGNFLLARLSPNGELDPTFAGDGTITDDSLDPAHDLAFASNGRIVSVAEARPRNDSTLAIMRVFEDGLPDPSFGEEGTALVDLVSSGGAAVAVAADDSVVFGGYRIGRLTSTGELDTSYGDQGTVFAADETRSIVLGPDGAIFAAVLDCDPLSGLDACGSYVLRTDADGNLDEEVFLVGSSIASGADRLLYVAGTTSIASAPHSFSLRRYSFDRAVDRDFAGRGVAVGFSGLRPGVTADLAIGADGKALVAANVDDKAPVVARFLLAEGGEPDADADGVSDRRDRCRLGYAAEAKNGCRRVGRELEIRRFKNRIIVRIDSRAGTCVANRQIRLLEKRRGPDRTVRVRRASGFDASLVVFQALDSGRYYAKVRASFSALARCAHARTPTLRFRRVEDR